MIPREIAEMVFTPRGLEELTRLDAEELAMRQQTDAALGVARDQRTELRVSEPWRMFFHDEEDEA